MAKFTADQLMMLDGMGWKFVPTGPNEFDWLKFDKDGMRIAQGGGAVWFEDIKVLDHARASTFKDDKGLKAAALALLNLDLDPSANNPFPITLHDLVPNDWGDAGESGKSVSNRIAQAIVRSVLSTVTALRVEPGPEVWEPTMELRIRVLARGFSKGRHIFEQKFIRTSGGPACGGGSTEWRALPEILDATDYGS